MARFSDRLGITKPPTLVQADSMDDRLRNSLWNELLYWFLQGDTEMNWRRAAARVGTHHLKVPLDTVPTHNSTQSAAWLRDIFFKSKWFEVYNLVEFLVQQHDWIMGSPYDRAEFMSLLNGALEEERSAYRCIDEEIVPITEPVEIEAVDGAITDAGNTRLDGVRVHLRKALEHFSRRPSPDYHNAIKEAISAVESTVKCMTGLSKAELGEALDTLAKRTPIHAALASACKKLYGYTSDEKGIRHALGLDEAEHVGFDEAKLMIVTCSAFVSFLIAKAEKAKVLKIR